MIWCALGPAAQGHSFDSSCLYTMHGSSHPSNPKREEWPLCRLGVGPWGQGPRYSVILAVAWVCVLDFKLVVTRSIDELFGMQCTRWRRGEETQKKKIVV